MSLQMVIYDLWDGARLALRIFFSVHVVCEFSPSFVIEVFVEKIISSLFTFNQNVLTVIPSNT